MKLKIFFLLLSLSTIASASVHKLSFTNGIESNANNYNVSKKVVKHDTYTEVSYSFEGAYIFDSQNDSNLQGIRMDDASVNTEVGYPDLPIYIDMFINPHQFNIEIVKAEYNEYDGFNIRPCIPYRNMKDQNYEMNYIYSDVYQKDEFYPKENVKLLRKYSYRSIPYISLQVSPIQYNPITKKLRCYKSLTYRIFSSNNTSKYDSKDYKTLKNVLGISEYEDKTTSNNSIHPAPSNDKVVEKTNCDYLIVTIDKYIYSIAKFAKWKTMQGHKCKIITKASWKEFDEVLSEIQKVYNTDKPEYLLIFGDNEDVPAYQVPCDGAAEFLGTPYYLSDLPYTTGGIVDSSNNILYPNMIHGRISVSDAREAKIAIKKIIDYERFPIKDESFYNTAAHFACPYDTEPENNPDGIEDDYFAITSETIRDYMMHWGKKINRQYNRVGIPIHYNDYCIQNGYDMPDELVNDNSLWKATPDSIASEINKGRFYVLYSSHGNIDGWGSMNFTTNNVNKLTNGNKTPVVFSLTCLSGAFGVQNCFAEAMLRKDDGGGVGVIAASNTSYFLWNDALYLGIFNTLFPNPGIRIKYGVYDQNGWFLDSRNQSNGEPEYEMGKVLRQGLVKMSKMINAYNDYTCLEYHYFGDPSMEIFTESPACFNPTITEKDGTVIVNTEGVPNCKITLSSDDGTKVFVKEKTNSATFENVTYPYNIVISKHNYKPYVKHTIKYIQNEIINRNKEVISDSIYAGRYVLDSITNGSVFIEEGVKLTLIAKKGILLKSGFRVNGGKLFAHIGDGDDYDCPFNYDDPTSIYYDEIPYAIISNIPENSEPTSILENSIDYNVQIEGDIVHFSFDVPTNVQIYDIIGRVVYAKDDLLEGKTSLNVGTYIIKYSNESKKIIIGK